MLRRALPVLVAAAAAVVLLPGGASATPAPAPVENGFGGGYSADVQVVLSDGRHATAWLGEYGGPRQYGWERELYLSVWSEYTCYGGNTCQSPRASGLATLTAGQLDFSRDLRGVSVADVPVTLQTWGNDPTNETVTVSVAFTGAGAVSRTADKGELCGDGSRECQSIRIAASRTATGTVDVDGAAGSGEGSLSFVQGLDVAAPTFVHDGS